MNNNHRTNLAALSVRRRQAAEVLGVSTSTLDNWVRAGLVPHVRIGKTLLFHLTALERWLGDRGATSSVKLEGTADAPRPEAE